MTDKTTEKTLRIGDQDKFVEVACKVILCARHQMRAEMLVVGCSGSVPKQAQELWLAHDVVTPKPLLTAVLEQLDRKFARAFSPGAHVELADVNGVTKVTISLVS